MPRPGTSDPSEYRLSATMLDTLIRNATVFDGLAGEPRQVAVGILGRRIVHVGDDPVGPAAETTVDAEGLYLCPGFIDTHASTGLGYLSPHAADNKLFQGVTTEIVGNCGMSNAPVGPRLEDENERTCAAMGVPRGWKSLAEWYARLEDYGLPINIGTHVGHSTLRAGVARDIQNVTREDRDAMAFLLAEGMADGALGFSTGLVYAPGSFADTAEIVELAKVAARYGGIYVSHIRDERQDLEDSVDEALEIGRQATLPVLISHLKAAERPNWGKIPRVIESIEKAKTEGLAVGFEVYPYTAVSTRLRTFIPKDTLAGGVTGMGEVLRTDDGRRRSERWLVDRGTDFDAMILITESLPGSRGKSLEQVARARSAEPAATAVDVLLADPEAWIVYTCLDPDDLDAAILWPGSVICSDSWSYPVNAPRQIGNPHPRTFGAFTRFLERYALRQSRLPFAEAIRKITSYPADWLGLADRGRITEGAVADLVLLDPTRVRENATFEDPRQMSEGTERVWVGGVLALEEGQLLGQRAGQILRGQIASGQQGRN